MTSPTLPETDTADRARPRYERQIDLLGEMAETGLDIARQAARLAKDAWDVEGVHIAALAHTRVARAVRLTLMLQAKLIKMLEDRGSDQGRAREDQRETRTRTIRIFERIAASQHDDADEVERLVEEAAERLDQDDLNGGLLDRPVSELVALICKDLGLDPDWSELAKEAWACEEMAGGEPGWPLSGVAPASSPGAVIEGRFRPSG